MFNLTRNLAPLFDRFQWINWKPVVQDDGSIKKVPYNPNTKASSYADPSNPRTWACYSIAQQYVRAPDATGVGQRGIGYVHARGCRLFTLDVDLKKLPIDDVRRQKAIALEQGLDTLSVVSPSGKGLHIHGWCDDQALFDRIGVGKSVEDYIDLFGDHGYVTMTDNVYRDVPIRDLTTFLRELLDRAGINVTAPCDISTSQERIETFGRRLDLSIDQIIALLPTISKRTNDAYHNKVRDADGGLDKTIGDVLRDLDKITGNPDQVFVILMGSPLLQNAGQSPSGTDRYWRTVRLFNRHLAKARAFNDAILAERERIRAENRSRAGGM